MAPRTCHRPTVRQRLLTVLTLGLYRPRLPACSCVIAGTSTPSVSGEGTKDDPYVIEL